MGALLLFIGVASALVVEQHKKHQVRQHIKQQEAIRQFMTSGIENRGRNQK